MNEKLIEEIENTPVDGAETPSELPEGTVVEQQAKSPADMAAVFFKMQQPRLNFIINKLSAKQMRRVIFNATSYPFVAKEYQPRDEDEKAAAYLIHEMMLNKTVMQLHFEMEQAEKALLQQQNSDTMNSETNEGEG